VPRLELAVGVLGSTFPPYGFTVTAWRSLFRLSFSNNCVPRCQLGPVEQFDRGLLSFVAQPPPTAILRCSISINMNWFALRLAKFCSWHDAPSRWPAQVSFKRRATALPWCHKRMPPTKAGCQLCLKSGRVQTRASTSPLRFPGAFGMARALSAALPWVSSCTKSLRRTRRSVGTIILQAWIPRLNERGKNVLGLSNTTVLHPIICLTSLCVESKNGPFGGVM
jgi:hypothetical protein